MLPPTLYALLCLSVAAGVSGKNLQDDYYFLSWPEKYTLAATRISLTSGIVEDYRAWKTNSSSRLDFNNGAMKSIVEAHILDYPEGVKYEIHPESSEDETNILKCNGLDGSQNTVELEAILPNIDDYEYIDNDPINDKDTQKFSHQTSQDGTNSKNTVWAFYNNETDNWVPVRYEIKEYNEWLGFLAKHEIWDFFEFETDFDDAVFETDVYDCSENYTEHLMDSELVTKHLVFINPDNKGHVDHVFNAFKSKYSKEYTNDKEHAIRKNIFQQKMRLIRSTNRKNLGYKLAVNQFADRTPEEMKRYQGLLRRPEGKAGNIPFPYTEVHVNDIAEELPEEYDLRLLGYVSWIKNQEDCGSCWTFGTTAAMEGALARVNGGKLLGLSNQALVDCAWPFGASGCDGGSDNAAYDWMMKFGLPTEEEYGPYVNKDGFCHILNMTVTYPIKGYTDVTPFSIGALKVALVNHGPLSVSVHVTEPFQLYSGGIFYDLECNPTSLNHEVALVGYGERDGETFWILKNSWGPNWGVDGYMLISARDNNCGVATEPTYVVL